MAPSDTNHPLGKNLWQHTSPPGPKLDPLEGEQRVEVAVIGAGFAGLSTALHLAESGCSVAIIEAGEVGSGNTGKSGGLVAPDLVRHSPDEIEQALGPEWGKRLVNLVGSSGRQCFEVIEAHNISCDASQTGFWRPAHNVATAEKLQIRAQEWQARGFSVDYIDWDETSRRLGSPRYRGALRYADGGSLNPLAFARGLADAVINAGATIYTHSPVKNLLRHPGGWRVVTDNGQVMAKKVVLAANAGNAALHPAMKNTVIPFDIYEFATVPVIPDNRRLILPEGGSFTDTNPYIFTARYDRAGRLVSALPEFFFERSEKSLLADASRRLKQHFPALDNVSVDYLWKGTAQLNLSLMPKVYNLQDDAFAIQACNGRGVANNIVLGKEMAAALIHGNLELLSVKTETPSPILGHRFVRYMPSLLMTLAYIRNRIRVFDQFKK